jgi:hypothetical protein
MHDSRSPRHARCARRGACMIIALPFAAAGVAFGCARSPRPETTAPPPPRPLPQCTASARPVPRDSFPPYGGPRPPENLTLRVSRGTPAGLTSFEGGPTGRLVLQMVDTMQADTVRAALAAAFVADGYPAFAVRIRAAALRPVAFSAADLVDWHTFLSALLFNETGREGVPISGVGGDFHRVRVVVEVPTETARTWVEARLARADVPCGLVQTEIGGGMSVGRHSIEYWVPARALGVSTTWLALGHDAV